ncbi:MAG: D-alanine--D-alanine ligase [Clostridiales bacterium]|jgi:D-alanine-D-alanine ligase|nr:D-alanine--D-alanine ligase [Clostridiales bacterium]
MKIIVLAGGLSNERDVSLTSGALVANALIKNGHRVALIDTYLGADNLEFSTTPNFSHKVDETLPNLDELIAKHGDKPIGKNVLEFCQQADIVFNANHGGIGENGMLSAILDCYKIKYTGSSQVGMAISMNKNIAKVVVQNYGLNVPLGMVFSNSATTNIREVTEFVQNWSSFPCVVKPMNNGSSVGVALIDTRQQLTQTLTEISNNPNDIDDYLVEERIVGREFSVGVLAGNSLPSIEIIPQGGFYDYKHKYQAGATLEICPAEIPSDLEKNMQKQAIIAHNALLLGGYSRTDFIVTPANKIYFLETNSLPGMTPTSLLPQEAQAVGIDYNQVCEEIIKYAIG